MLKRLVLATSLAVLSFGTMSGAEAKTRFSIEYLFDDLAPHPESYYFDEEFDNSDGVIVYEREPRESVYGYEEDYYQPEYQPPKRKLTQRSASINKPPLAAPKKPAQKLVLAPKEQSLDAKTGAKKKSSVSAVSCAKATDIVKGYGFSDVKVKSCDGKIYAFTGARAGKTYEINLSSASGALTEVKRI